MFRVEDLEVLAGVKKQLLAADGHGLHCCLVVAHEVEQSAHLTRGLLRPPACLDGAGGSTIAGKAGGLKVRSDQVEPVADAIGLGGMQGLSSVRGLPTRGAGAQDLVK